MAPQQRWYSGTFARTALPMFGFVLLCWYGLDQLVSSKLKIRVRGDKAKGWGSSRSWVRYECLVPRQSKPLAQLRQAPGIRTPIPQPSHTAHPQQSVRGYDKVEEYDPIERLRRLEGARGGGGSGGGGGNSSGHGSNDSGSGPGKQPGAAAPSALASLEEELAALQASLKIDDFDYKPVPRTVDDEE
jgi:uncharacterized membrane protein YgcG